MGVDNRSRTLARVALIAVELIVTVGALVVLFRGVDVPETARAFRRANYWLLLPAMVFLVLDLQFRAVRWRLLLWPRRGLSHGNLFGATNVGYLVNDVLPFRAGEVARVFLIDELEKTGKIRSAASIAVERGIDVIAMIALVIAMFPFVDEPGWTHGRHSLIGSGVVVTFLLAIVLSHVNETDRAFWKAWLRRVPRIGGYLDDAASTLLMALHPLRQVSILAAVVGLTAVIWTCGTELPHGDEGIPSRRRIPGCGDRHRSHHAGHDRTLIAGIRWRVPRHRGQDPDGCLRHPEGERTHVRIRPARRHLFRARGTRCQLLVNPPVDVARLRGINRSASPPSGNRRARS